MWAYQSHPSLLLKNFPWLPLAYLVNSKLLSFVFEVFEDLLPAFHAGLSSHQRACPGGLCREAGCIGSVWMAPWQRGWQAAEISSWSGLEYPQLSLLPGHSVQDAWEFQVGSSLHLSRCFQEGRPTSSVCEKLS